MAKTTNWISTQGEVFTGTAAELCREYGIKHRKGLQRPGGAPDAQGDRWVSGARYNEQGGIKKRKLYLGPIQRYGLNKDGEVTTWFEAESNIASNYKQARKCIELIETGRDQHLSDEVTIEGMKSLMKAVETEWDVVDNDVPTYPELDEMEKAYNELDRERGGLSMRKSYNGKFGYVFTDEDQKRLDEVQKMKKDMFPKLTELRNQKSRDEWKAKQAYKASIIDIKTANAIASRTVDPELDTE